MMCDVPSIAVCPGIVSRYFCKLLLTISVAPMMIIITTIINIVVVVIIIINVIILQVIDYA
jgi:hypothetical protein